MEVLRLLWRVHMLSGLWCAGMKYPDVLMSLIDREGSVSSSVLLNTVCIAVVNGVVGG